LRHYAKFMRIGRTVPEMADFRCFKMAAVRNVGFVLRVFGTTHEEHLVVFVTV